MIPILILAAGQSSRMRGSDKLLEDVGGVSLLRKQVQMALPLGGPVFVALPPSAEARQASLDGLDAVALIIDAAAEGMSATLREAVAQLPDCPAFMVVLGDLVAMGTPHLRAVHAAYQSQPDHLIWRGATADGKPGHPIIFDSSLRPQFALLEGDHGGETLVNPLREQTLLVPLPDQVARRDLDTPEDWMEWRAANLPTEG